MLYLYLVPLQPQGGVVVPPPPPELPPGSGEWVRRRRRAQAVVDMLAEWERSEAAAEASESARRAVAKAKRKAQRVVDRPNAVAWADEDEDEVLLLMYWLDG